MPVVWSKAISTITTGFVYIVPLGMTPQDKLEGREKEIFAERDRKLEAARKLRQQRRQDRNERLGQRGCTSLPAVVN
jgi:hypothetical protein